MGEVSLVLLTSLFYGALYSPEQSIGPAWQYSDNNGAESWSNNYPQCSGSRQSPIDISPSTVRYVNWLTPFEFTNYPAPPGTTNTLVNNGYTASLVLSDDWFTRGSILDGGYKAVEVNFHWGREDNHGSEHSIDGQKHALEIHIVHYAEKYGSLENAVKHGDGLAVIAVFADIQKEDNPLFNELTAALQKVQKPGQRTPIYNFRVTEFLPMEHSASYYHYTGSLTTPPCRENALWFIMKELTFISSKQLEMFRRLQTSSSRKGHERFIERNSRPTKSLDGRVVFSTKKTPDTSLPYFDIPRHTIHRRAAFRRPNFSISNQRPSSNGFTSFSFHNRRKMFKRPTFKTSSPRHTNSRQNNPQKPVGRPEPMHTSNGRLPPQRSFQKPMPMHRATRPKATQQTFTRSRNLPVQTAAAHKPFKQTTPRHTAAKPALPYKPPTRSNIAASQQNTANRNIEPSKLDVGMFIGNQRAVSVMNQDIKPIGQVNTNQPNPPSQQQQSAFSTSNIVPKKLANAPRKNTKLAETPFGGWEDPVPVTQSSASGASIWGKPASNANQQQNANTWVEPPPHEVAAIEAHNKIQAPPDPPSKLASFNAGLVNTVQFKAVHELPNSQNTATPLSQPFANQNKRTNNVQPRQRTPPISKPPSNLPQRQHVPPIRHSPSNVQHGPRLPPTRHSPSNVQNVHRFLPNRRPSSNVQRLPPTRQPSQNMRHGHTVPVIGKPHFNVQQRQQVTRFSKPSSNIKKQTKTDIPHPEMPQSAFENNLYRQDQMQNNKRFEASGNVLDTRKVSFNRRPQLQFVMEPEVTTSRVSKIPNSRNTMKQFIAEPTLTGQTQNAQGNSPGVAPEAVIPSPDPKPIPPPALAQASAPSEIPAAASVSDPAQSFAPDFTSDPALNPVSALGHGPVQGPALAYEQGPVQTVTEATHTIPITPSQQGFIEVETLPSRSYPQQTNIHPATKPAPPTPQVQKNVAKNIEMHKSAVVDTPMNNAVVKEPSIKATQEKSPAIKPVRDNIAGKRKENPLVISLNSNNKQGGPLVISAPVSKLGRPAAFFSPYKRKQFKAPVFSPTKTRSVFSTKPPTNPPVNPPTQTPTRPQVNIPTKPPTNPPTHSPTIPHSQPTKPPTIKQNQKPAQVNQQNLPVSEPKSSKAQKVPKTPVANDVVKSQNTPKPSKLVTKENVNQKVNQPKPAPQKQSTSDPNAAIAIKYVIKKLSTGMKNLKNPNDIWSLLFAALLAEKKREMARNPNTSGNKKDMKLLDTKLKTILQTLNKAIAPAKTKPNHQRTRKVDNVPKQSIHIENLNNKKHVTDQPVNFVRQQSDMHTNSHLSPQISQPAAATGPQKQRGANQLGRDRVEGTMGLQNSFRQDVVKTPQDFVGSQVLEREPTAAPTYNPTANAFGLDPMALAPNNPVVATPAPQRTSSLYHKLTFPEVTKPKLRPTTPAPQIPKQQTFRSNRKTMFSTQRQTSAKTNTPVFRQQQFSASSGSRAITSRRQFTAPKPKPSVRVPSFSNSKWTPQASPAMKTTEIQKTNFQLQKPKYTPTGRHMPSVLNSNPNQNQAFISNQRVRHFPNPMVAPTSNPFGRQPEMRQGVQASVKKQPITRHRQGFRQPQQTTFNRPQSWKNQPAGRSGIPLPQQQQTHQPANQNKMLPQSIPQQQISKNPILTQQGRHPLNKQSINIKTPTIAPIKPQSKPPTQAQTLPQQNLQAQTKPIRSSQTSPSQYMPTLPPVEPLTTTTTTEAPILISFNVGRRFNRFSRFLKPSARPLSRPSQQQPGGPIYNQQNLPYRTHERQHQSSSPQQRQRHRFFQRRSMGPSLTLTK